MSSKKASEMVGVLGSRCVVGRHVNADEARQPVGDDGEWPIDHARCVSFVSDTRARTRTRTHTPAVNMVETESHL